MRWEWLLGAALDPESTIGYTNLRIFTKPAAERTAGHVLHAGERVLAWNPGILVR